MKLISQQFRPRRRSVGNLNESQVIVEGIARYTLRSQLSLQIGFEEGIRADIKIGFKSPTEIILVGCFKKL